MIEPKYNFSIRKRHGKLNFIKYVLFLIWLTLHLQHSHQSFTVIANKKQNLSKSNLSIESC